MGQVKGRLGQIGARNTYPRHKKELKFFEGESPNFIWEGGEVGLSCQVIEDWKRES